MFFLLVLRLVLTDCLNGISQVVFPTNSVRILKAKCFLCDGNLAVHIIVLPHTCSGAVMCSYSFVYSGTT